MKKNTTKENYDKKNDNNVSCSKSILDRAKQLNRAFYYSELDNQFSYGTLRNAVSTLRKERKILKIPKENPARFILPEWASRPEYSCVQRNDKNGMGVKFDLFSFLEGLPWDPNLSIHAIKLRFEVYSFHWLGDGWTYSKRSHSYRRLFNLSYPINVQCFDTGTVLVSVKSSVRPFNLDLSGLLSLTSLLGELRERLRAPCIPEPTNWLIVQWHLNRDSEPISIDGISFHVTFRDFFHNIARLYYKNELERVRAEAIQSPKRTIKNLLESVLNRGQQI
ncbi:MAG: hypothetical protein D4S01_00560 [Dehalococcoidia bacterium]|nr:MAG: hypothetical protein D4S01_00560 [Dehalococcoidia bacterium]